MANKLLARLHRACAHRQHRVMQLRLETRRRGQAVLQGHQQRGVSLELAQVKGRRQLGAMLTRRLQPLCRQPDGLRFPLPLRLKVEPVKICMLNMHPVHDQCGFCVNRLRWRPNGRRFSYLYDVGRDQASLVTHVQCF